jgi:DNA topoisomerase VI subunit B
MSGLGKKDRLQQKSPAEFFADNKNIAGFDNVGCIDLLAGNH